jgi:hypothetical protein
VVFVARPQPPHPLVPISPASLEKLRLVDVRAAYCASLLTKPIRRPPLENPSLRRGTRLEEFQLKLLSGRPAFKAGFPRTQENARSIRGKVLLEAATEMRDLLVAEAVGGLFNAEAGLQQHVSLLQPDPGNEFRQCFSVPAQNEPLKVPDRKTASSRKLFRRVASLNDHGFPIADVIKIDPNTVRALERLGADCRFSSGHL